jgi:SAM-dependent methyltransferase
MARTHPFDTHPDEYDLWFIQNQNVFQSELKALRNVFSAEGRGVEIGVGSGIFAEPLGIPEGIEPSEAMRNRAKQRNIKAINGIAENLPYPDRSLDFTVMITTICFVDDVYKSMYEAHRVLKDGGSLIIGFVDKDSPVGREYLAHKEESVFYREAVFYGTEELYGILDDTGFIIEKTCQTVFGKLDEVNGVQDVLEGYGKGSFVVIKAGKRTTGSGW